MASGFHVGQCVSMVLRLSLWIISLVYASWGNSLSSVLSKEFLELSLLTQTTKIARNFTVASDFVDDSTVYVPSAPRHQRDSTPLFLMKSGEMKRLGKVPWPM